MAGVLYTTGTTKIPELLRNLQKSKAHMAVVVDEYGGTAGIVTMEDILETIVGDISDEFDKEDETLKLSSDGTLDCDGQTDLADVYEAFGMEVPEEAEDEYDTIGGLVTGLLGYIPTAEEKAECVCGELRFTVTGADERKVTRIRAEHFLDKALEDRKD